MGELVTRNLQARSGTELTSRKPFVGLRMNPADMVLMMLL
jgi:hypothetical protein